MDEKLAFQVRQVSKYLGQLQDIAQIPREEYLNDHILQGASERYLHLCIESCINIGNRLISILQTEERFAAPKTYADVFRELEKHHIIKDLEPSMIEMTKFRNRLVHLYWDIAPETVYEIIQTNLQDIDQYLKQIVSYLSTRHL